MEQQQVDELGKQIETLSNNERQLQLTVRQKDAQIRSLLGAVEKALERKGAAAAQLLYDLGIMVARRNVPHGHTPSTTEEFEIAELEAYLSGDFKRFKAYFFYGDIDFVRAQKILAGFRLSDQVENTDLTAFLEDRWIPSPYTGYMLTERNCPAVLRRYVAQYKDGTRISEPVAPQLSTFLGGESDTKWNLFDLEERVNSAKYYTLYCLLIAAIKKKQGVEDDGVSLYNRKVFFKHEIKPLVSIVIPVYGKYPLLAQTLISMQRAITHVPYEVIVVDDCSPDFVPELKDYFDGVTYIKNRRNLGFGGACNTGANRARGKYVYFLNSDVIVTNHWLDNLVKVFDRLENVGAVGSKLLYPNGRLQEAGCMYWKEGNAWNFGRNDNPDKLVFNYTRDVDYCSAASLMVRSDILKKINGFDPIYKRAYAEDSDMCFKIKHECGARVIYEPTSEVIHLEGGTNGTDLSAGFKQYQIDNHKIFVDRWRKKLDHKPYEDELFFAKDADFSKPRVLVIDHYIPKVDRDTGSKTVYDFCKELTKACVVKFWPDNLYIDKEYINYLLEMGIEVFAGNDYANKFEEVMRTSGKYFDYVLISRPHIAIKYFDVIRKYSKAKIYYYGHDLHFERMNRENELLEQNGKPPKHARSTINEVQRWEFTCWQNSDMIFYPTERELEIIRVFGFKNCATVPIFSKPNLINDLSAEKPETDMLFVGGFAHEPNIDGIKWFIDGPLKNLRLKKKKFKITVCGSSMPGALKELFTQQKINFEENVSNERLEELYKKTRIVIAPLRYGSGLKGKVIEAMMNKKPVVSTTVGFEGLPVNKAHCKDTVNSFTQEICQLLEDTSHLAAYMKIQEKIVKDYFSLNNFDKTIKDFFTRS
jgi:GT2 family glycosyltransferase